MATYGWGRTAQRSFGVLAMLAATSSASALAGQAVRAQSPEAYMMERDAEISLARSAGPENVASDATVLVMKRNGEYEVAAEGTNGWNCFVGRGWTAPAEVRDGRRVLTEGHFEPNKIAPQCFNELASKSVLPWHRMTSMMFMQGMDSEAVEDRVQQALKSKQLSLPESGAMSYMLSPKQHLSDQVGAWNPHFMLYTPYAEGLPLFGEANISVNTPFVTDGGGPWAVTTMVAGKFSDGTPAPHTRR